MSAQPANDKAPDLVTIEIDGRSMDVPKGSMIIEAADNAGITIPRFCYHRKLSIAANCRMCMVDVEMGGRPMPKPAPACATPVADGMKVRTRSDKALHAQRNVMEFLLINHPLDCPICDQGGECELQDVSLGYGRSVSRYTERKRSIADENLGPLIATEMTRCIQCTRCVRFMGEIAGTYELGGMSRGDRLEIGTYIGKSIESEIGGNIIDVCPVGALTNKPFQFKARAWELIARPSIGYHDAMGSNLWLHTRRGEVLRTVPRDAEAINECWLSDRDRYSHEGMYADDRALKPMVKRDGVWHETDWDDAIGAAVEALQAVNGDELGMLVHGAASNEEGELLMRLARGLGSAHVDHRLRQLDMADAAAAVPFGTPVEEVSKVGAAVLIGSQLRFEMPLLHHRLRMAGKAGATCFAINPAKFDYTFEATQTVVAPNQFVDAVLGLARAAVDAGATAPDALAEAINGVTASAEASQAFAALKDAASAVVVLGEAAALHPQASWLRAAARFIAEAAGAGYNELPLGANAIGLARTGVLPGPDGLDAQAMLAQPRKGYVLFGAEPPYDFADGGRALAALRDAQQVVAFSAYASEAIKDVADVILPIALLPETDATLTNVDGRAQTLAAGARAPGEARPGWRVLRAVGGALDLAGFEFDDLAGLRDAIARHEVKSTGGLATRPAAADGLVRLATLPIYRGDAVLRRAKALNAHPLTTGAQVRLAPSEAGRLSLAEGDSVRVADAQVLPVVIDADVPEGTAWIEAAYAQSATLPPYGAAIQLTKA